MKKLTILLTVLLTACGGDEITHVHQTNQILEQSNELDHVSNIVQQENEFRAANGDALLVPGLRCSMYTLTSNPSSIPSNPGSVKHTFGYIGEFNQPESSASLSLNVIPEALRSLYTSWYLMRCTGFIVIEEPGYQEFDLTSDDGSMLYINNSLVVDNNGNHSTLKKSGGVSLKYGVHQFRLDYMQSTGNQSLILEMNGKVIPSKVFYR